MFSYDIEIVRCNHHKYKQDEVYEEMNIGQENVLIEKILSSLVLGYSQEIILPSMEMIEQFEEKIPLQMIVHLPKTPYEQNEIVHQENHC